MDRFFKKKYKQKSKRQLEEVRKEVGKSSHGMGMRVSDQSSLTSNLSNARTHLKLFLIVEKKKKEKNKIIRQDWV